ncbi:MAG: hypothetical protein ACOY3P_09810 [Planctomycetota bacterium]
MRSMALSLAAGLMMAGAAFAGDCCTAPACCDPGCDVGCGPVCNRGCCDGVCCPKCGGPMMCKVVCETKEIKKHVWNVKCEPFCVGLPQCGCDCCGDPGCGGGCNTGCDVGCADAGCCGQACDPCAVEYAKTRMPPKCGPVRTRKVLEKKEITCEVPCYKCVPVCCHCNGGCGIACGDSGCGVVAPVVVPAEKGEPKVAPAPTPLPPLPPLPKTTRTAPMPPVIGASYVR